MNQVTSTLKSTLSRTTIPFPVLGTVRYIIFAFLNLHTLAGPAKAYLQQISGTRCLFVPSRACVEETHTFRSTDVMARQKCIFYSVPVEVKSVQSYSRSCSGIPRVRFSCRFASHTGFFASDAYCHFLACIFVNLIFFTAAGPTILFPASVRLQIASLSLFYVGRFHSLIDCKHNIVIF
uniref:Uncharacterized protein n=1 Tax=Schistocephalus solidus TaxID=70667 RepID=A0A0X3PRM0_SCHSO